MLIGVIPFTEDISMSVSKSMPKETLSVPLGDDHQVWTAGGASCLFSCFGLCCMACCCNTLRGRMGGYFGCILGHALCAIGMFCTLGYFRFNLVICLPPKRLDASRVSVQTVEEVLKKLHLETRAGGDRVCVNLWPLVLALAVAAIVIAVFSIEAWKQLKAVWRVEEREAVAAEKYDRCGSQMQVLSPQSRV